MRLMLTTLAKSSSARGPLRPTIFAGVPTPAQLTTMRATPWASRALATAASVPGPSVTSQTTPRPPISLATASAFSMFMSKMETLAPAAANARAVASPNPEAPPVTIAASPSTFMLSSWR